MSFILNCHSNYGADNKDDDSGILNSVRVQLQDMIAFHAEDYRSTHPESDCERTTGINLTK